MHLPLFLQPRMRHELRNELINCLQRGGLRVIEQEHSSPKSFSLHSIRVSAGTSRRRWNFPPLSSSSIFVKGFVVVASV